MFKKFYPGEYLESAYGIDFEKLYQEGYRGIIFDIDNTLVPHGAPADDRAKKLFGALKELGYRCCLLSNNKEPRVKMFNDEVQVDYIFKAGKPKVSGYERAMELMGTNRENTLFVGDQIFTDVMQVALDRADDYFSERNHFLVIFHIGFEQFERSFHGTRTHEQVGYIGFPLLELSPDLFHAFDEIVADERLGGDVFLQGFPGGVYRQIEIALDDSVV